MNGQDPSNIAPLCCGLALVVIICVCYQNTLDVPFLLDDHGNIVGNVGLSHIVPDPQKSRFGWQRGVGHITFAVNHRLARRDTETGHDRTRGYHVVNIAIHCGAALALFGLVRRSLLLPNLPEPLRSRATGLAFVAAIIWSVHPLQTGAVTYIIQRLESLMGLCYLLCLYCAIRGVSSLGSRLVWYAGSVVAFSLGLFVKEVMITAPVVLLIFDYLFLSPSWRELLRQRWGLYLAYLPAAAFLAYILSPAHVTPFESQAGFDVQVATPLTYLYSQAGVILHYLRLAMWPVSQVFDYAWPITESLTDAVIPGTMILILLAGSVVALRWQPAVGFLALTFFVTLAPTSSIMPIRDPCFEYRMYLPLAPLTVLAVLAGHELVWYWHRRRHGRRRTKRTGTDVSTAFVLTGKERVVITAVTSAVVVTLCLLTVRRNEDYRTEKSIWLDTVAKRPQNARAHVTLGNLFLGDALRAIDRASRDANLRKAMKQYTLAAEIPSDRGSMAFTNRGRIHALMGDLPRALGDFDRAIQRNPRDARAFHNRATAKHQMGQHKAAISDFTKTLSLLAEIKTDTSQNQANAYSGRALAYYAMGQYEQARADCDRAIDLQPGHLEATLHRGACLIKLNQLPDAIGDFDFVVQHGDPTMKRNALSNRAVAHLRLKNLERARQDLARLKQLGGTPDPRLLRLIEGRQ